ncbi:protein FAR-RED IMPAIRED RESPONSE 1-like [Trifolium pratense]|uniref:protein FAR-RED IMPAIRED RESPONSE 1-like n=1 Tax=Trifolium pratense TaxID=57577 RepID=UPI001E6909A0|nr:protein FAR-RED IMPAIRED RESPONSE 1-like [Trifolium pratense]
MEEIVASSDKEKTNEGNRNCNSNNDNLAATVACEDEEPRTGMTFSSEEEVTRYYMNYAKNIGFGVGKISSKNGDDGKKYFTLACNCSRRYVSTSKNPSKQYLTSKTQCRARLNACMALDGTITVSRVVLEHNHELGFAKGRYFRLDESLGPPRLELNDQVANSVGKNLQSVAVETNGFENLTLGEKDCRNHVPKVRRLRLGRGDVDAIHSFFHRMQKQNSQFYCAMDMDDKGIIQNLFWADARSRAAYEYFGEVITFDTTYSIDKYDLPLTPFVGVNHHGQSILLGCAILSNMDTKTLTWLFTRLLECMHGHAPNGIITNEDSAMKSAIQDVFPKARHLWCLWHIMKKVPEILGKHSCYESIKTLLDGVVYDSLSKSDFTERWGNMVEHYKLHDNEWLKGLFDERHRWVPVYVKETFWAGMSTTQRSESIDSYFDGYVNSKTTLKLFVEQYDTALNDKIEKESMADFDSFNTTIACVSHFGFEIQFQKAFTNAKFIEFQVEVSSMMYCNTSFERLEDSNSIFSVTENKKVNEKIKDVVFKVSFNEKDFKLRCTCCLFEFKGILCRHILCVLKLVGKTDSVPPYYIFPRWMKYVKRRYTLIKRGFEELQRVNIACDAFYEVASTMINSEDDLLKVLNLIKDLKNVLTCKEPSSRSAHELSSVPNHVTRMLDPTVTQSNGCPPLKRKTSNIDQILKKKLARNKQKNNQENKNDQCQEEGLLCTPIVQEIDNEEHLGDASQVLYCPQIRNQNVSCSELLQAQHHMNDPSS